MSRDDDLAVGLHRQGIGILQSATPAQLDAYDSVFAEVRIRSARMHWARHGALFTTITWQDGSFWFPATTPSPQLTVTDFINQNGYPPITITATDANGNLSRLRYLSSTMLIGVDGVMQGVRGTRLNGNIFWMNGQTWDNLNANALNAFFEMGTGYP